MEIPGISEIRQQHVIILGGYGNFGKRIAESLVGLPNVCLWIAGRNLASAEAVVAKLRPGASATINPMALDFKHSNFAATLKQHSPYLVIHTGGPFQGQDYAVPQACIDAGAHYIDLADDRRFVCDITRLDSAACAQRVLVVSGASTVPGLSSVVIDHYCNQFSVVDSLDMSIAPGNRAERGEATIRAILSYTGHVFPVFEQGRWQNAYGWMHPRKVDFGDIVGRRWLANVDVPELELFPGRYAVRSSVQFQAGLELSVLHLTMVAMAQAVKCRVIRNWAPHSRWITRIARCLEHFGSDRGGMRVVISGNDLNGKASSLTWSLYAGHGVGPFIPTLSAVILAKKLLQGMHHPIGAMPCLGLYSLDDFYAEAHRIGVYAKEQWSE